MIGITNYQIPTSKQIKIIKIQILKNFYLNNFLHAVQSISMSFATNRFVTFLFFGYKIFLQHPALHLAHSLPDCSELFLIFFFNIAQSESEQYPEVFG